MLVALGVATLSEVLLDLLGDDRVRHGDLDELDQLLQDLVTGLDALTGDGTLGGLLLQVLLELVDGVELGGQLGELVVGLGQLALLDGIEHDLDLGLLAGAVATGQRGLEDGVLAGGQTFQGLVHAVEHGAGTDLVGQALGVVDLLIVDGGGQGDGDEVVLLRRTLHVLEGAEAGAEVVQSLLLVLFGGGGGLDGDLQALIVRQLDLRAHVQLGGELQRGLGVAVGAGGGGDLHLGAGERRDLSLDQGRLVELVQTLVDGGLDHEAAADPLVDDARRHLALAEAGNLDLVRHGGVGLVDARLEVLEGDLHVQLDPGGAEVFCGALDHVGLL